MKAIPQGEPGRGMRKQGKREISEEVQERELHPSPAAELEGSFYPGAQKAGCQFSHTLQSLVKGHWVQGRKL